MIGLETKKAPIQEIAGACGVERYTICGWSRELLDERRREKGDGEHGSAEVSDLQRRIGDQKGQVGRLELEKDILEGTIEMPRKTSLIR